jgi:hypothetical protein
MASEPTRFDPHVLPEWYDTLSEEDQQSMLLARQRDLDYEMSHRLE